MRILVLGGSYFIGRALVIHLLAAGHEVILLNRGTRPVPGARQLVADRDDLGSLCEAFAGLQDDVFDAVLDTSGLTGRQAALACEVLEARVGRWIFLSSSAVYVDEGRYPLRELDPVGCSTQWGEYGTDKLEAERTLAERLASHAVPLVVLRAPYIYGPGDNPDRDPWLWARMLKGRPVLVPDRGATSVQFVHTEDLAAAFDLVLDRSLESDQRVFNVGHPLYGSFLDYVRTLARVAGIEPDLRAVPYRQLGLRPRAFFPFRDYPCVLDTQRIRDELSWRPRFDLESGLRQTFESYDRDALREMPIDTRAEDAILASPLVAPLALE